MQAIIDDDYQRYLTWLKARKKRDKHLGGWTLLQGADFWKGLPNERAARMVAQRYRALFGGAGSWRNVKNFLSGSRSKSSRKPR